jgi:uncharacterized protein
VLSAQPGLATAADPRTGRVALHECAKRRYVDHTDDAAAGMATVHPFLDGGTPFDIVHPIAEGDAVFPATPLWYAVAHGDNAAMARLFLDLGASPDRCVFAAVWTDNAEIMIMLLDAGAPVDAFEEGATPLIYAARLGREAVMPLLVAAGADRTATDHKGRNALRLARARKVSPHVLEMLQ